MRFHNLLRANLPAGLGPARPSLNATVAETIDLASNHRQLNSLSTPMKRRGSFVQERVSGIDTGNWSSSRSFRTTRRKNPALGGDHAGALRMRARSWLFRSRSLPRSCCRSLRAIGGPEPRAIAPLADQRSGRSSTASARSTTTRTPSLAPQNADADTLPLDGIAPFDALRLVRQSRVTGGSSPLWYPHPDLAGCI
jgi:hypothetical protein